MLVLSRRTNETLVIDHNIRFTVLSVHGNQVRIGIEAPEEVIILREEIIHNGSRAATPNQAGDAGENAARAPTTAAPSQNEPYRRHDRSQEQGKGHSHEQVKRRGVLGLRRRRP